MGPMGLNGFDYIAEIDHANPLYTPANKGYNLTLQYGIVTGFKWKKIGVQLESKTVYYEQKLKQNDMLGSVKLNYVSFGLHGLYQFAPIYNSSFYHTVKVGIVGNYAQSGMYALKSKSTGDVYADTDIYYTLQDNYMLSLQYGISMGYRLLYADFSLCTAYSINSIYKPDQNVKGHNFYIGLQLAFGIFASTQNK